MFRSLQFYIDKKVNEIKNNPNPLNIKAGGILFDFFKEQAIKEIKDVFFDFQKHLLIIKISNPVFAQEVKNKEGEILELINKNISNNPINKIIVKF